MPKNLTQNSIITGIAGLLIFLVPVSLMAYPFSRIGVGIRNMGMGDTGIALSYDENALHYNPAGLGGVDKLTISLPSITLETTDLTLTGAQNAAAWITGQPIAAQAAVLGETPNYSRISGAVTVLMPLGGLNFGGSYMLDYSYYFHWPSNNPLLPFTAYGINDVISTVGFSLPLDQGRWILGLGARKVTRKQLPFSTTYNILVEGPKTFVNATDASATAIGYDLGLIRRIASLSALRMSLGLVVTNFGGLKFSRAEGVNNPVDIAQEVSVGWSMQPTTPLFRLLVAIDYRDITFAQGLDGTTADTDINKRLHFGTELGIWPIDSAASAVTFRTGYYMGNITTGFEVNLLFWLPLTSGRLFTMQYASYTEEIGTTVGTIPSKRQMLQISMNY